MGLYDDDNASVTTGDLNVEEYWKSKMYGEALEYALKTKQPEGAIKDFLKYAIEAHDKVLKTYANHEDVKKWKAKAETIKGKLNPKAEWVQFNDQWPWNSEYENGWIEYWWAKHAKAQGDWRQCHDQARSATNHLGEHGAMKQWKAWKPDLQKWITDALAEMVELEEEARSKK